MKFLVSVKHDVERGGIVSGEMEARKPRGVCLPSVRFGASLNCVRGELMSEI